MAGSGAQAVVSAPGQPGAMQDMAGRLGQALPVGHEGAGLVVKAGASPAAQALQLDVLARHGQRATGEKCLINPSRA